MPHSVGGENSRWSIASSLETDPNDEDEPQDLEAAIGISWRRLEDAKNKNASFDDACSERMAEDGPDTEAEESGNEEGEDVFESSCSSFSSEGTPTPPKYHWQLYAPDTKNVGKFFRWAMVGGSKYAPEQTDEELMESLAGLARCLHLLREYLTHYGMPEQGGPQVQELVLREVIRDLYEGGAPLWALEPVMQKAAEGLTGQPDVNWQLYPRKAFIYNPSVGTTSMFPMDRGFNISKMSAMEGVVVRLASFASNVQGVSNIPARWPNPKELTKAARRESARNFFRVESKTKLASKILGLASRQEGLFYYVNSQQYKDNQPDPLVKNDAEDFWVVSEEERELFSRLASQEALAAIDSIDAKAKDPEGKALYSPGLIMASRLMSSAGACAIWFGGSWQDMIVAGFLAIVVAFIGTSSLLSKQERLVYEVVASFVVGLTSGLLALTWPDHMCFSAMAISGVLDLLQGFRVVYAVIEIMSKHTVSGGADLLEGILFTGLISYFLQFGSYVAASLRGNAANLEFVGCSNGVDGYLYILLVPLTALTWSILFTPNHRDLPGMAFHGILGYCVQYALDELGSTSDLNYFVSASAISISAGIYSRFTGRQAVANTVAGMYAILPGAYMLKSVFSGSPDSNFFADILKSAVIIGIGGWTGTILCSPTLLGTTRGLLWQRNDEPTNSGLRRGNSNDEDRRRTRPMLFREDHARHLTPSSTLRHTTSKTGSLGRGHRAKGNFQDDSATGPSHQRIRSSVTFFDFEHPTSTMLFF